LTTAGIGSSASSGVLSLLFIMTSLQSGQLLMGVPETDGILDEKEDFLFGSIMRRELRLP